MVIEKDKIAIGTLDYGIRKPKWFYIVLLSCALTEFTCCIAIFIIFSAIEKEISTDCIIVLIIALISLISICVILMFIYKEKLFFKNKIPEYLNDEKALRIKTVPFCVNSSGIGVYKVIKLGVKFIYDKTLITVIGKKYYKQFRKYVNKEVEIIYSPKFEQVIILSSIVN